MSRLLDQIVTTWLRDFAPTHPAAQAACLAILLALVFLSVWAMFDTWKSVDSEGGLPPPGPRIQAMLGITLLKRLPLFLVRSPAAPQVWVCTTLLLIAAAIIAPAILQVRDKSRRQQLRQNLKQLGTAMHNYHDTFLHYPNEPKAVAAEPRSEVETPHEQNEPTRLVSPLTIFLPTGR
ncbi:MAG: DUF1559 domain-containing protein [Planctomycetota bacterium]